MADSVKALQYAENNLGVHKVYEEAKSARERLEKALDSLSGAHLKKREFESALVDQEMLLLTQEWGKHPERSATAMDTQMKRIKNSDPICRELRTKIASQNAVIDAYEIEKSLADADIKIAVARLQELGGYLQFLAAIKNEQANDANQA